MRKSHRPGGAYRTIWSWEASAYAGHLKRLDRQDRRRRFHGTISDAALEMHAERALRDPSVRVIGWFKDGVLRGAVEIAMFRGPLGREAEAAFAVESRMRGAGVGAALMRKAALFARNRGAKALHVSTEADNRPMIALAAAFGAEFTISGGDVDGAVTTGERTVFSIGLEAMEEESGLLAWAFHRLRAAFCGLWVAATPRGGAA